jgi:hypothetical protein
MEIQIDGITNIYGLLGLRRMIDTLHLKKSVGILQTEYKNDI